MLKIQSKIGFDLNDEEILMTIIIISVDQNVHAAFICKNTDIFNRIEERLYVKYPEYKEIYNNFLYKGKLIDKFKTIEENGIEDSAIITLNNNYINFNS